MGELSRAYLNFVAPPDGEIVFPAGILQPPFYSLSWPSHLKYGAFGGVAAHELTHAFDNSGSQYDESGRSFSTKDLDMSSSLQTFRSIAGLVDQLDRRGFRGTCTMHR